MLMPKDIINKLNSMLSGLSIKIINWEYFDKGNVIKIAVKCSACEEQEEYSFDFYKIMLFDNMMWASCIARSQKMICPSCQKTKEALLRKILNPKG